MTGRSSPLGVSNLPWLRCAQLALLSAILLLSWSSAHALDHGLGDREEEALQAAVARVAPSVVRIQTVGGMEAVEGVLQGSGPSTGLVVSPDGYIISSAYNFARKPSAILVSLPQRSNIPARLVATDHSRALVLLKIDLTPRDEKLAVPEAAPPGSAKPGAWAVAVGRTFEPAEPNISVGIVSAVGRIWSKALQTDAKVSPANYGGPLVDLQGRVLGVLVPMSPMSSGDVAGAEWYDSGIGFAIPLSDIERILPRLMEGHDLRPGLLGVSLKGKDMFGAVPVIAACPPGSPAFEAGLRPGDRIVSVNGRDVVNQSQFRHQIGPLYSGDKIQIAVMRDKKRIEASLRLIEKLPPFEHAFLGVLPLRDPSDDPGISLRYVYPDSAAAKAGLRAGDRLLKIDSQDVANMAAARELLNTMTPGQQIALEIEREKKNLTLSATLGRMPEDIPGELPPARTPAAAGPADAKAPPAQGVVEIKIPEMKNKCFAYVPPQAGLVASQGVLIWLAPAGKIDRDQLVARWKGACDAHDLILLVPQAREADRWQADEVEFIGRALEKLGDMYELDPLRVSALGQQGGGTMAFLIAFEHPGVLQGVAAVDAALPASVRPSPIEPTARLAILLAHGTEGQAAALLGPQIERLRTLKYPVSEIVLTGGAKSLDDAQRGEVIRWIDTLDRF